MFNSAQIELNANTPTALIVEGSGAGQFGTVQGNIQDQLPMFVQNMDSETTIYIGGPNVTAANGFPLYPEQAFPIGLYGSSEIPYAIAASGTPLAAVLIGRQ